MKVCSFHHFVMFSSILHSTMNLYCGKLSKLEINLLRNNFKFFFHCRTIAKICWRNFFVVLLSSLRSFVLSSDNSTQMREFRLIPISRLSTLIEFSRLSPLSSYLRLFCGNENDAISNRFRNSRLVFSSRSHSFLSNNFILTNSMQDLKMLSFYF